MYLCVGVQVGLGHQSAVFAVGGGEVLKSRGSKDTTVQPTIVKQNA